MKQKIAIIGASASKDRYSNKLIRLLLQENDKTIYPVNPGIEELEGLKVYKSLKEIKDSLDIISIYLSPAKFDKDFFNDIQEKNPSLVIFNPGTEDNGLIEKLKKANINVLETCTIRYFGKDPFQI